LGITSYLPTTQYCDKDLKEIPLSFHQHVPQSPRNDTANKVADK
jgi:hypothetical protein